MNIEQKVNLHNRFDIEVINSITGEVKQKAEAYNIVLDQMYTRLCGGSSYFVNIHFGTGTGTLSPSRTSLFTHLGTKAAANEELIKAIPVSSWKRKIVLNPEEFVGSTITEVGIAFGATNTNLVTHAMLKDAEGNPISITKTDTDVINIYATVFVTFAERTELFYASMPDSNTLVNYLIGGGTAPTGSFGLNEIRGPHARLGSTATVTWTSDTANKQRKTNVQRFSISTGNGHVKTLDFTNVFDLKLPATGIFSGQAYSGVPIGTGDGTIVEWSLPSANIRQDSIAIKINGASTSAYTKNEKFVYSVKRNNPAVLPIGTGRGVALTPDGLTMAVSHLTTPYVSTYDWTGGAWVKRNNPTVLPTGNGNGVSLTPDGLTMAVAHLATPYVSTYDWVGGAWVKRDNPSVLPAGYGNSVALTPDGLIMAVAHDTSPFVSAYDWTGGAWVKRANPAVLPAGTGNSVALTPDGLIMAGGHNTAPYVSTYECTPMTQIMFDTSPAIGDVITADYTVDGVHKTDQYVIDVSFAIQFGEGV